MAGGPGAAAAGAGSRTGPVAIAEGRAALAAAVAAAVAALAAIVAAARQPRGTRIRIAAPVVSEVRPILCSSLWIVFLGFVFEPKVGLVMRSESEGSNQSIESTHLVLDRAGLDDHITVCLRGDLLPLGLVIVVVKLACGRVVGVGWTGASMNAYCARLKRPLSRHNVILTRQRVEW